MSNGNPPAPNSRTPRIVSQAVLIAGLLTVSIGGAALYFRNTTPPAPPANVSRPDLRELELRSAIAANPQEPRPRLTLIGYLLSNQRRYDALKAARDARAALPTDPAVQSALAEALGGAAYLDEAITLLRPIAKQQLQYQLRLAALLVKSGRTPEAVTVLRRLPPLDPAAALLAGQVYLDALEPEAAVPLFKTAAASEQTDPSVHLGFGLLLAGRYAQAVPALERAVHQSSHQPVVSFYTGSALRLSGDLKRLDNAEAQLQQAVEGLATDSRCRYELALSRAQHRRWEDALSPMEEAANLSPNTPEIQRDLARLYERLHQKIPAARARSRYLRLLLDPAAAVRELAPLAAAHPDQQELIFDYADALSDNGKGPQALSLLKKLAARSAAPQEVFRRLSLIAQNESEYEPALAWLDQASGAQPERRDLVARADLLLALARHEELEQTLIRLLAVDPSDATSHYRVGRAYSLFSSRPDHDRLAEENLKKAVELSPAYAEAHYALAVVLQRTKRPKDAVHELCKALDLRPEFPEALRLLGGTSAELGEQEQSKAAFALYRRLQARELEEKNFQIAVKRPESRKSARKALYQLSRRFGDLTTATSELEILEREIPDDQSIHRDLALLYGHAGRFQRMFEERALTPGTAERKP